jgi:hypothetical protein
MTKSEFEKKFCEIAELSGFKKGFEGWFKESIECIVTLTISQSPYKGFYSLDIRVFVQGLTGRQ